MTQENHPFRICNEAGETHPALSYQSDAFFTAISEFFEKANPSNYIDAQNELIDIYLGVAVDRLDEFQANRIRSVIRLATLQSQFIAQLNERFHSIQIVANRNDVQ